MLFMVRLMVLWCVLVLMIFLSYVFVGGFYFGVIRCFCVRLVMRLWMLLLFSVLSIVVVIVVFFVLICLVCGVLCSYLFVWREICVLVSLVWMMLVVRKFVLMNLLSVWLILFLWLGMIVVCGMGSLSGWWNRVVIVN